MTDHLSPDTGNSPQVDDEPPAAVPVIEGPYYKNRRVQWAVTTAARSSGVLLITRPPRSKCWTDVAEFSSLDVANRVATLLILDDAEKADAER